MDVCKHPSSFLFQLLQGRQCLFEVRSVLHWHGIGTLLVRMKPPVTLSILVLVGSYGWYDLHPHEHPIVDKVLRLDDFQSFVYGMFHLV